MAFGFGINPFYNDLPNLGLLVDTEVDLVLYITMPPLGIIYGLYHSHYFHICSLLGNPTIG